MKERICHFLVNWVIKKKSFLLDTELVNYLNLNLDLSSEKDFDSLYKILQEVSETDAFFDQPFLASVLILSFPHFATFFKEENMFENVSGYGCYISESMSSKTAIEWKNKCISYWESQDKKGNLNYALEKYRNFKSVNTVINQEVDYLELKKQQKELGDLGEFFVIEELKRELKDRRIATDLSGILKMPDIEGYDFQSFDATGNKIFVELKTTSKGIGEPFYLSRNEYQFLRENAQFYYLYRVYDFDIVSKAGKINKIPGTLLITQYEFEPAEFVVRKNELDILSHLE